MSFVIRIKSKENKVLDKPKKLENKFIDVEKKPKSFLIRNKKKKRKLSAIKKRILLVLDD